jgi:hypothetical protein
MAGGSDFQPRFTRAIAAKNRSHNQKPQIQNYKVSFSIKLAVLLRRVNFFGQGAAFRKNIIRGLTLSGPLWLLAALCDCGLDFGLQIDIDS